MKTVLRHTRPFVVIEGIDMINPAYMDPSRCSCGNSAMCTALAELMANHWSSEPNSSKRQQQVIESLSNAVVLLGADIVDGKVRIHLPPLTAGGDGATHYNFMPSWEKGEEKMMAVCTGCYRYLLNCPAQLPPEEFDLTVREFEPPLSALPRSIFFYMRRAAADICEWLARAG